MNSPLVVPKVTRYTKHSEIDEIASSIAIWWLSESSSIDSEIVDVEDFVATVLDKEIRWDSINEPPNRTCFASLTSETITLNSQHRGLFTEKPFILRSSLAHEVGHSILRHVEALDTNPDQPSLFEQDDAAQIRFHDSALRRFDLSNEEYLKIRSDLARIAAIDWEARQVLAELSNRLEPEWMFYQAEQFASCFLIPKNKLFECIADENSLTTWRSLYALAKRFEVSISMMCVRLQKLNLISLRGRQIIVTPQTLRLNLT